MTPEARRQIETSIAQMEAHIAVLRALLDEDCDCPEASPTTLGELWEKYLATLPDEQWVKAVKSNMKRPIAALANERVVTLKPLHWEAYRDAPETKARYSVTSRNLQIRRLKTMLNWAVDSGWISKNPLQRARVEKGKPKRQTEISFTDEKSMLGSMDATMRAMMLVAADSGMRNNEIRLLEWTDIDWTTRKITIPPVRTKNRNGRIGRITTRAADALMAISPIPDCPWVFANPKTKRPWSKNNLWQRWTGTVAEAEVKPAAGDDSVRFHDLRRTHARRLSRLGAPIAAIQKTLDHSSLATTALYVEANAQDVDDAHALLEAAIRKGPHAKSPTVDAAQKTA